MLGIKNESFIEILNVNTLQWRQKERDGISNHRRLDCLLNRLSRSRSLKTPKLRVTIFGRGIHMGLVNWIALTKGL